MKRRCVIICAAHVSDVNFLKDKILKDDYVICADGGYHNAREAGIDVDLFVGDLDSSSLPEGLQVEKVLLPREKDQTDTEIAIMEGLARGYKSFAIFCAVGQRLDHTYANLCLLKLIHENKALAEIIDERSRIFFMGPGQRVVLTQKDGNVVSVFPFGCGHCTLSYDGLKYPLKKERLYIQNPRGISNEVISDAASIRVYEGNALIILEHKFNPELSD